MASPEELPRYENPIEPTGEIQSPENPEGEVERSVIEENEHLNLEMVSELNVETKVQETPKHEYDPENAPKGLKRLWERIDALKKAASERDISRDGLTELAEGVRDINSENPPKDGE